VEEKRDSLARASGLWKKKEIHSLALRACGRKKRFTRSRFGLVKKWKRGSDPEIAWYVRSIAFLPGSRGRVVP